MKLSLVSAHSWRCPSCGQALIVLQELRQGAPDLLGALHVRLDWGSGNSHA